MNTTLGVILEPDSRGVLHAGVGGGKGLRPLDTRLCFRSPVCFVGALHVLLFSAEMSTNTLLHSGGGGSGGGSSDVFFVSGSGGASAGMSETRVVLVRCRG